MKLRSNSFMRDEFRSEGGLTPVGELVPEVKELKRQQPFALPEKKIRKYQKTP